MPAENSDQESMLSYQVVKTMHAYVFIVRVYWFYSSSNLE